MTLELVENTGSATVKTTAASLVPFITNALSSFSLKGKSTKLPTFHQAAKGQNLGEPCQLSSNTQVSAMDPKHKFLVVCVPLAKRVSKTHQPDVRKIHSDRDFFKALRQTYSDSRRSLKWRWFGRVSSIDFVKVRITIPSSINADKLGASLRYSSAKSSTSNNAHRFQEVKQG